MSIMMILKILIGPATIGLMLFSTSCFGQTDQILISYQLCSLDTSLKPEYYRTEITVAEFHKYYGKGKKSIYAFQTLDSIKLSLEKELIALGFIQPISLINVTEKTVNSYYSNESNRLMQTTLQLNIPDQDSVDFLFKNLSSNNLTGFRAFPELNPETLKVIEDSLMNKCHLKIKEQLEKYSNSASKYSSVASGTYGFYKKQNQNHELNQYGQLKQFYIDFSSLEYTLSATFAVKTRNK